jgi:hypothetical protein
MKNRFFFVVALGLTLHVSADSTGCGSAGSPCAQITAEAFHTLTQTELEALFQKGDGTVMPSGELHGRALFKPGTGWGRFLSSVSSVLWKGKYFDIEQSKIDNLVGPFANRAISGDLGTAEGIDGKPSIIVRYSDSLGDEIRWLGGGSYLGRGVNKGEYGVFFYLIDPASSANPLVR